VTTTRLLNLQSPETTAEYISADARLQPRAGRRTDASSTRRRTAQQSCALRLSTAQL